MFSALGIVVGFLFIIDVETYIWTNKYKCQWKEPARYSIISWHSDFSARLNNATVTGDVDVILPPGDAVTALAANARHLAGICVSLNQDNS